MIRIRIFNLPSDGLDQNTDLQPTIASGSGFGRNIDFQHLEPVRIRILIQNLPQYLDLIWIKIRIFIIPEHLDPVRL